MVYVYKLVDPLNQNKVYIGITINPKERYMNHLNDKGKTKKGKWIRELKSLSLKPEMVIIEVVDDSVWQERERFWIKTYKENGYDMLNTAPGGEGTGFGPEHPLFGTHPSLETRQKMGETKRGENNPMFGRRGENSPIKGREHTEDEKQKMRVPKPVGMGEKVRQSQMGIGNSFYGKKHTDESIEKMRESHLGHPCSDDARKKISNALVGRERTEEHRRNISIARRGIPPPESAIEQTRIRMKGNQYRLGIKHTEADKEKMSEIQMKRWDLISPRLGNSLVSPDGIMFSNITYIKGFAEQHGLNPGNVSKLMRGKLQSYRGWKLAK